MRMPAKSKQDRPMRAWCDALSLIEATAKIKNESDTTAPGNPFITVTLPLSHWKLVMNALRKTSRNDLEEYAK